MHEKVRVIFDSHYVKNQLYNALYRSSQDEYRCFISQHKLVLSGEFLELGEDSTKCIVIEVEANTTKIVEITWARNSIERLVAVLQCSLHQPAVLTFTPGSFSECPLITIEV